MYADRTKRFSPLGAGAALTVNGALIAGLVLAFAPVIVQRTLPGPLETYNVPPPKPPPPIDEVVKPRTAAPISDPKPYVPPVEDPLPSDNPMQGVTSDPQPAQPADPGPVAGNGAGEAPPAKPTPPPLVGAEQDPRYARDFQPEYPGSEIRTGREGTVSVRVLIGADGRVKAVEQLRATSQAFFDATKRQALAHWRFKPATRGGVPQESWKTMSVRFQLSGEE